MAGGGAFSCTKIHVVGNVTKVLFIVFNVIFMMVGFAILVAGAYLASISTELALITGSSTFSGAILIVVAGLCSMLLAIMGILAAVFQLRFILLLYVLIVAVVIIIEIAAGIYGFTQYRMLVGDEDNNVVGLLETQFGEAVANYRASTSPDYNKAVVQVTDYVQNTFECCGVVAPSGWNATSYYQSEGQFPPSCCEGTPVICNSTNSYSTGCLGETTAFIENNIYAIGAIGLAFGFVEMVGIALAIVLCIFIHVRISLI